MIRHGDTSLHTGGHPQDVQMSPGETRAPKETAMVIRFRRLQGGCGWGHLLWALSTDAFARESGKAFQGKGTECTTVQRLTRK